MNVPNSTGREIDIITADGEIVSGLPTGGGDGNQSLAVSLARAEIDQQIATAQALPRSLTRAVSNILALATLDEETAKECVYALPRGGKPIKGPSIRLAEIIQSQYGNNRVGTRVVHVDRIEKYVESEGVFHDLETNSATTARVRRRISDKNGQVLSEDMIIVTSNAASSIAKRNAILGGVPKAVWRKAYAAVERVLAGDIKTLAERRGEAMKAFAAFGVTPDQIFAALAIGGLDDVGLEEMTTLVGMHSALKSGEATVEEMFQATKPQQTGGEKPKTLGDKLDALANGGDKASASQKKSAEPSKGDQANKTEPDPSLGSDAQGKQASSASATAAERQPSSDGPQARSDDGDQSQTSAQTRNHATETTRAEKPASNSSEAGQAAPDGSTDGAKSGAADPTPADARRAGAEARAKGAARKAIPAVYRKDDRLRDAWLLGFDSGSAVPTDDE